MRLFGVNLRKRKNEKTKLASWNLYTVTVLKHSNSEKVFSIFIPNLTLGCGEDVKTKWHQGGWCD